MYDTPNPLERIHQKESIGRNLSEGIYRKESIRKERNAVKMMMCRMLISRACTMTGCSSRIIGSGAA